MKSYRDVARRLEALEELARADERQALEALTDDELEVLCADAPPEMTAAVQALSDADLDRAIDGELSMDEILARYRAAA